MWVQARPGRTASRPTSTAGLALTEQPFRFDFAGPGLARLPEALASTARRADH
ncbi:hypothetical protein ACIQOW_20125 [Kitasatospora sp. NPDC091335]|uniref:hypothetical protein n=1 Tax=Kitasatospora sp. NPDC091335 TaxID=3364085 RepID=UPI00380D8171